MNSLVLLKLCCCNHHHIFQQSPVPALARTAVPPRTVIQGNYRWILSLCSCCTDQQVPMTPEPVAAHACSSPCSPQQSARAQRALGLPTAGTKYARKEITGLQEFEATSQNSSSFRHPWHERSFIISEPNTVDYAFQTLSS